MSIPLRTHKMLWGRSANRCSFCRLELVIDRSETDDESIVGDECHIVAQETDGPRGDFSLPLEQRDKYSNLILLCKIHHKLIDDQPNTYTVEQLQQMKADHEKWVKESLQGYDQVKQRDDEMYAWYIEEWLRLADVDNWLGWSSYVLTYGQPRLQIEIDKKLEELRYWLFSRIWPKRYHELEAAFENFLYILQDFQEMFRKRAKSFGDGELVTEKFYKIDEWDPARYEYLSHLFDFHVDLVEDLMLELTRAANYICDKVRQYFIPTFRLKEGSILVQSGPYRDLKIHTHRLEYRGSERTMYPYPGLQKFKIERKNRDLHFGEGTSIDDPEFRAAE